MRKMIGPKETHVWIPYEGVVDPMNITAEEANAGLNFSCSLLKGYTYGPTAPNTDDSSSVCDDAPVDTPINQPYEGAPTLFRDDNRADFASIYNKVWALWRTAGKLGYWVRRYGKLNTEPFVVGDEYEAALFLSTAPMLSRTSDDGGPVQFAPGMLQQGFYSGMRYIGPLGVPTLASITPAGGAITGGTEVKLTGTNLLGVTGVFFGSKEGTAPRIVNETTAWVTAPPHIAGAADVVVETAGGTTEAQTFTYA